MYRQQKSFSVSSTIWALIVTAIVLLIAASANAQVATPPSLATSSPNHIGDAPSVGTTTASTSGAVSSRQMELDAWTTQIEMKRLALANRSSSTPPARLSSTAQSLMISGIDQISTTLTSAIAKTKTASAALNRHAKIMEERGLEVSAYLKAIAEAEESVRWAEAVQRGLDTNARYAAASANPESDWQEVRRQFDQVHALITESQQTLRTVSGNLISLLTVQ